MVSRISSAAAGAALLWSMVAAPVTAQVGGKYSARENGRAQLDRKGGRPTTAAISKALDWLKAHQHETGFWGARTYQRHCPENHPCDGAGDDGADLQATGLAVLAFLADGSTLTGGPYAENVQRAVAWLHPRTGRATHPRQLQSPSLGRDRAIATLALVEAVGLSKDVAEEDRAAAQAAVERLVADQDARGGWGLRPKEGDADALTTAWAVMALKTAQEFRLEVPAPSLEKALVWLRQLPEANPDPAMTSASVLARVFLGDTPQAQPELRTAADTVILRRPAFEAGFGPIAQTWLFGSYAMYQMGSGWWNIWRDWLERVLLKTQRSDGHYAGSWDPAAGDLGGRVAATATAALCLEVYYRYTRIVR